jgi:hypothetical protein
MYSEIKRNKKRCIIVFFQLKILIIVNLKSDIRKGCTKDAHGTESESSETE